MRRVIFTLLYDRGHFMLSRNFRLQMVGSIEWLFDNYDFGRVSHGLDELMVLDVSRASRDPEVFTRQVSQIARRCFIPVTVGGGVDSMDVARAYMRSGADKLLLNSAFADDPQLCRALANYYGTQCIVAGIDYRTEAGNRRMVMTHQGQRPQAGLARWVEHVQEHGAGEILLQSIDRDGTGMGLDLEAVSALDQLPSVPCILMGGVGKADHILNGLCHPAVDAVATANLFNFIGDSFLNVRASILRCGTTMAQWSSDDYASLERRFCEATTANVSGERPDGDA